MKKRFLICLLVLVMLLLPATAFADEVNIFENEFTEWVAEIPYGWDFDSMNGGIERGGGEAEIYTDYGYAFISTTIELEPSSAYRISADVSVFDVPENTIGANINILDQYAESGYLSGTVSEVIDLYVQTNVDDTQLYTLRIGLGNEENFSAGTVCVDSVKITEIDMLPEDENVYTLIGSFSYEDLVEVDYAEEDDSTASVASYNTTGTVLVGLLFSLLFYLFFTSKWAKRFSEKTSNFYILTAIFLFAFLLRIFIASRSEGHISDLNCFKAWAVNVQSYGLSAFYESGIFADYMPGYYYVLYVIGGIYNLFGLTYDSVAFRILVELVPILCDLALAFFAYRIIRKSQNERIASLCAICLLFIPFGFTDSAIWGQIDSVFTLALLGSLALLRSDKKVYSCLVWAVALMIKPQALLAAPVIAIVFLKDLFVKGQFKKAFLEALLSLVGIAAAILLLSLPMKGSQPLLYVIDRMLNTTGQYAYGTVNAFNFFGLLGGNFIVDSTPILFGLTYRTLGWILIGLSTALIGVLYSIKGEKKDIFLWSGLYLLLIYVFAHNMHERYVYPALVLLLLAAFERDSREIFFPTAILSGLFFANMFIVLEFRQDFVYSWITTLFSALYVLFAILTVAIVCLMLFRGVSHPILLDVEAPRVKLSPAELRLKSAPHVDRRMKGRDWLVMLLITAVYSVVMLTNLGSTNIPEQAEIWTEENTDVIVIELSEEAYVQQMKYYTGYCSGNFRVTYSADGENYYETYYGEVAHDHAMMFRWYTVDIEDSIKYVKIEKTSGYLELREIAFFDAYNELLPFADKAYMLTADGKVSDASYLIDEQTEAPSETSYMTEMYFDEVYHARTAYEYTQGIYPYEITHPPLGKAFISLGIMLFGMNPFGWRFAGAVAGILMIPVLYVFAKRIFRKTKYAAFSAILFAVDFMHYSLCRIATIDSFTLLFILLMYLCMYEYTLHNFNTEKLSRTLLPLGLCGLFFALGAAVKWISLYAGLGLAIIFFYTVYQRSAEYRVLKKNNDLRASAFSLKLILTLLFCVGVFIILPIAVYCLSYLPYEWASPDSFGLKGILDNQSYMFNYHGFLVADPHPYASQWQTWPFSIRPVFFFLATGSAASEIALIWCMGNPILWWSGVAAFLYIAGKRAPEKHFELNGLGFLLLAAVCQLAPNLLITREMFLYHYFTLVPFFCIGIVYVLKYVSENYRHGTKAVVAYIAILCIVFALFYPLITGTPIRYSYGKAMQWLSTWPI